MNRQLSKIILLIVCLIFCVSLVHIGEAEDVSSDSKVYCPYMHGYRVVGIPDEEYEYNGFVHGNILDEKGSEILPQDYLLCDLSDCDGYEDIIIVASVSKDWYLFGFYDRQSSFFCEPCFEDISYYTKNDEKLIAVMANEKWGFCNRSNGNIEIPFQYDAVSCDFSNGYAIVIAAGTYSEDYFLIDQQGMKTVFPDLVIPISTPNDKGELIIADQSNDPVLFGVADVNGAIIVTPCYDEEEPLYEALY